MRFDAAEHLAAWKKAGTFPKIHNAIAAVAVSELVARTILDLGCSHGLLGARLVKLGVVDTAIGIDVDSRAIEAGKAAGVPVAFNHLKIEKETMPEVMALVKAHRVTGIIARRILPELFGADPGAGRTFALLLARAGVKEMLLEGRIVSAKATNPLQSIDAEVSMVAPAYREVRRVGAVSYLLAR